MLRAEYPDATLIELSELLLQRTGNWVSRTPLCRPKQKLGLNRKKKHGTVAFAGTERVQKLRVKYWEKIKKVEVQNLVFLDETGIMLGLARTHARSQVGTFVWRNQAILSRG